jgi:hypothetical protein
MEDGSLLIPEEGARKPQSLRSLANYKKKPLDPSSDNQVSLLTTAAATLRDNDNDHSSLPLTQDFMETELGNSKATFIGVDSDLSQIFGTNLGATRLLHEEEPLECDPTIFQEMRSHQRNVNAEGEDEILRLQSVIELLQLENQKLVTSSSQETGAVAAAVASKEEMIIRLHSEISALQDQVSNLQFDIKERDDQVPPRSLPSPYPPPPW